MRMEKRTYQAPDFEMERFAKDEMAGDTPSDTYVGDDTNLELDEVNATKIG